jgi:hypothetical protein
MLKGKANELQQTSQAVTEEALNILRNFKTRERMHWS